MQLDFHYYATYCAAYLAGYSHEDAVEIAQAAQFVDCCTSRYLSSINGPKNAATTQTQIELADASADIISLQNMTRIWSSFHFLPYDLKAKVKGGKRYTDKYRLICKPNGILVTETVKLAKNKTNQAAGVAMHVLADTWAHSNFAGTPSMVINNTNSFFYEIVPDGDGFLERKISLKHNPSAKDDPETGSYTGSVYHPTENSIMNLGHGRCGHLPDYSYARYEYLPAWNNYDSIVKDNPSDYFHAFCQMIYALKYLNGSYEDFDIDIYEEAVNDYVDRIKAILEKRQLDACEDWKQFGEALSQKEIPDYQTESLTSEFVNKFITAAIDQKSMVTNRIFESGNLLAGYSRRKEKKK